MDLRLPMLETLNTLKEQRHYLDCISMSSTYFDSVGDLVASGTYDVTRTSSTNVKEMLDVAMVGVSCAKIYAGESVADLPIVEGGDLSDNLRPATTYSSSPKLVHFNDALVNFMKSFQVDQDWDKKSNLTYHEVIAYANLLGAFRTSGR